MIIPNGADRVVLDRPYIAEYKNFLSKKQCKAILKLCPHLTYTQGQLRINGQRQVNLEQRNAFTHIISNDDDPSLSAWTGRIAQWLKLPNTQWVEASLLIHYPPGGEFKTHTDVVSNILEHGRTTHRTATVVVYLNDEYQGGRTVFPMHRIAVDPEAGKALLFCYNYPDKSVNDSTIHYGQLVNQDKYILVFFIRDQEYPDTLRTQSYY